MLRQNKPLPESPKIVAAVERAHASAKLGEVVRIFVPWEDFVFSTRNGMPYLPPTIAEGIRRAQRGGLERGDLGAQFLADATKSYTTDPHTAWASQPAPSRTGVYLYLLRDPFPSGKRGEFDPNNFLISIDISADASTLRHELLHFVQEVGSQLIKLATKAEITVEKRGDRYVILRGGKPTGRESKSFPKAREFANALREPTGESLRDERGRVIFGGTKHKLQAVKKGKEASAAYFFPDVQQGRSELEHSERETEMHTDALSAAIPAANRVRAMYLPETLHSEDKVARGREALAYAVWHETLPYIEEIKSPALRNAFLKLVWQITCRELGIPETMSSDVASILLMTDKTPRAPGMFVAGKRVKGAALEAHREVVAKRGERVETPPPPPPPPVPRPVRPPPPPKARPVRPPPPPPPKARPVRPPPKPRVAKAAPKAPAMLRVEQKEDGWYVGGKRFGSQKAATLEYIRQLGG